MSLAAHVESWHPEPVTDEDALPPGPAAALSALLDLPGAAAVSGEPLPPLWQWLYFLHWPAQRALAADGHPCDGRFLSSAATPPSGACAPWRTGCTARCSRASTSSPTAPPATTAPASTSRPTASPATPPPR